CLVLGVITPALHGNVFIHINTHQLKDETTKQGNHARFGDKQVFPQNLVSEFSVVIDVMRFTTLFAAT
ncbi:MAG: hypothetical protein KGZ82_14565, partial [Bacteroidales bacterium]|nr:hypothetical protein [Bacteroidales bacterium]